MTTQRIKHTATSRRTMLSSALLALGFGVSATACASSDADSQAVSEPVEANEPLLDADDLILPEDPVVAGGAGGDDGLQYGDSIEEVNHLQTTEAEPINSALPGFRALDWDELIRPGFTSEEILARYEDRFAAAEFGSAELDELYAEMDAEFDGGAVNTELDTEKVQLAGFVAPLTFDGDAITEFLLVPYFGACIHVPAPPANQTVLVSLVEGESLSLEESWGAVWVAGEMSATTTTTDLATAGYSISGPAFGVYQTQ